MDTARAGSSGLQDDAASEEYTYVWRTDRTWSGTCRRFTLTLSDGSAHHFTVRFH